MNTRLLLLLWLAFWACLSLRHVPPPAVAKAPVCRQPVWPSPELWQELVERRPSSFVQYPGDDDGSRRHSDWTPLRVKKQPYLLRHAEQCHLETAATWEQLASGRRRLADSTRYYSHPLSDVRLMPSEIAAYEELLTRLEPEPREALVKALNRIDPDRMSQLLAQFERSDSPDWWLDAEALSRMGNRRGLERILASKNPDIRSLAPVLEWLTDPEDARRWRAAMQVALQEGPAQKWASARMLQFGPETLRIRAYTELIRSNPYLDTAGAAGLEEWGWRMVEKDWTRPEAQQVVKRMLGRPWSATRQRQARRMVLDQGWPSELRKSVASKLLSENPANLAPKWLELWPNLWGDLPIGYGHGPAYRKALAALDRSHYYQGNLPERLWLAGLLTPARVKKAMRDGSDLSQEEMGLSSALRDKMPSSLLARLLEEEGSDDWTRHFWQCSVKQDAGIDRSLLARLGRGHFSDYFTMELLFRRESRFDPKTLAAIRERGGGPGGIAAALMGKIDLGDSDANFLACHLIAHLYLKHDNLPLERVCELQEGAPARLFQAAQAYLEASSDPLAARLVRKRGGRILTVEGQALCRWLDWLPPLRREVLERQTPILAWADALDVRSEVRGSQLRIVRGAETRIRQLTNDELAFLKQLQKPVLVRPYAGYASHFETLLYLAPQGGWALNLATLPPGHPARNWNERLWEISQKPGGTVEWSFAADFPKVETLAYYPQESFEGIALSQGRPVLKTSQGWCDLQLKPCPGPRTAPKLRWQAVDETSGIMTPANEKTRLKTLDLHPWSYLFHGLKFENFCVEGRELYLESCGRVIHLTLPQEAGQLPPFKAGESTHTGS